MVVVKEQHDKEAEGDGNSNPLGVEIPEVNDPTSRLGGMESLGDGDTFDVYTLNSSWDVGEADPKDCTELGYC